MDRPLKFTDMDYTPGGGKIVKNGVRLCHINTDYFKHWIHGRIAWPEDQPGGWHLYNTTSEDYCRQIVAEEHIVKASGRPVWVRRSKENHYLDCEVGATAAAYSLNIHKLQPIDEETPAKTVEATPVGNTGAQYKRNTLF